ncbi:MAG: efflux RND transporter periplasmic adaptor subunit [Planctomycetales bacterium]|nr:efflux RND transporter periplasmic adaptor subunit [Planctomycetales bacterium]
MNDARQHRSPQNWLRVLVNALVCLAILAASAAAIVIINRTEPTAQTINATRKSAALVETVTVERGTYSPKLVVLGSVRPAQDVLLSPRVRGQVTKLSAEFVPGGMVRAGETLLEIDPSDFENAVSIRQSEVEQAEASLEIEEGRQSLAKKELALLEGSIDETNRALVLREPQLVSIKAQLHAAQAALERAKLDLERTKVVAPFDSQVMSRAVNVGSQVGPGDELGQLVGVDQYWMEATVPVRTLRWVQFPETDGEGSAVILRNRDAWGPAGHRPARVSRMIGTLDQRTRLARILITVDDPLSQDSNAPRLILDTLMEVEIEGRPIEDVVRLPRDLVRDGDTVWVLKDEKLEIRQTDILFRDAEFAYVQSGLHGGDEVVVTTLATVAEGVGLRKMESTPLVDESSSAELTP